MPQVKFDKDVDVRVDGTVNIEVFCSECGNALEIENASSGECYRTSDRITVVVKPHKCPPEIETNVTP